MNTTVSDTTRPGSRRAHIESLTSRPTLSVEAFTTSLSTVRGVESKIVRRDGNTVYVRVTDAQGRVWGARYEARYGLLHAAPEGAETTSWDRADWFREIADEGADNVRTPEPFEQSQRIDLGDGHADVDAVSGRVEVTVQVGRSGFGMCLSADEAGQLGSALVNAARQGEAERAAAVDVQGVETVDQLLRVAHEAGVRPSSLLQRV